MDVFAFLDGASPWWWVAFAIAIGAVEMLTFTYFMIWPALAAFGTAIVMWIFPGMSGTAQIATFAALSVIITLVGRYWIKSRRATPSDAPGLNRRSEQVIGRVGKALSDFENSEGVVVIDGVRWRARLAGEAAAKDQTLSIIDADGMTLICEPISGSAPGR
ncbi:MAG: NfeD family protein [Pseudomonadota bacterium]